MTCFSPLADAFYFDEYPAARGGDWSPACHDLFAQRYGEPMPTELGAPICQGSNPCIPCARDARVLELMSHVTEEYFARLSAAIAKARPSSAAIVSIFRVPAADNGAGLDGGRGLYETSGLLLPDNTVAKTELAIPTHISPPSRADAPEFEPTILKSFGYTVARDGADKPSFDAPSPGHIWIPGLDRPSDALCSSATMISYGAIANPDHKESDIPDDGLFASTYALAANLSAAWAEQPSLRPVRYASVLFSESARAAHLPDDVAGAWDSILYPTVGAFRALVRARLPAKVLVDWQLLAWCPAADNCSTLVASHPIIVSPSLPSLPPDLGGALAGYSKAGGTLIETTAAGERWNQSSALPALEAALLENIEALSLPPRVQLNGGEGVGAPLAQLTAYESARGDELLLFALNDFEHCWGGSTAKPMPAVTNLTLSLSLPEATAPLRAIDRITGDALTIVPSRGDGPTVWSITLPPVPVVAAVAVTLGPLPSSMAEATAEATAQPGGEAAVEAAVEPGSEDVTSGNGKYEFVGKWRGQHGSSVGLCTCSLVAPEWVITAAHCATRVLKDEPVTVQVTFSQSGGIKRGVTNCVHSHSNASAVGLADAAGTLAASGGSGEGEDVALCKLKTPLHAFPAVRLNADLYKTNGPHGPPVTCVGTAGGYHAVGPKTLEYENNGGHLYVNNAGGSGMKAGDSGGAWVHTIHTNVTAKGTNTTVTELILSGVIHGGEGSKGVAAQVSFLRPWIDKTTNGTARWISVLHGTEVWRTSE